MTSPFKNIKIALDTRLSTLPGTNIFAWENIKFKPTLNSMYIRSTLLPGRSSLLDIDSDQENPGIYQVDVIGPVNIGMASILDKLDDIYTHFKAVETLESNDIKVYIKAVSILRAVTDEAWFIGSLEVNYNCYSDR